MVSHISFQIYVEIERARLTRTLAKIKEDQGSIAEAAEILQELQVSGKKCNIILLLVDNSERALYA